MGKTQFSYLILAILLMSFGVGCAPSLRPNSNAFQAGPQTSIAIDDSTAPLDEEGVTISQRASQIDYGKWSKEEVNADLSQSISNLLVSEIEWDEAQQTFRVPVTIALKEKGQKNSKIEFSFSFQKMPEAEKSVEVASADGKYSLSMVCVSEDCSEKILRLKRVSDGAIAVMKNIRDEEVLVPIESKKEAEGIPVVQHFTEVKGGHVQRQITDRDGSHSSLDPYLKNPGLLKKLKVRHAIDVPALTEETAPGISKKTPSEKLVWIGEQMIEAKTKIPNNACNRYVLWDLAASGYKITFEPNAHNFLTLILMPQFRMWHTENYKFTSRTNNDIAKLNNRLSLLPERKGVILQYSRGRRANGHVSILFREGTKFYVLSSSLGSRPPNKRIRSVKSLLTPSFSNLNVIFPSDLN